MTRLRRIVPAPAKGPAGDPYETIEVEGRYVVVVRGNGHGLDRLTYQLGDVPALVGAPLVHLRHGEELEVWEVEE